MRAWLALRASGVEFDEEIVDIRRPRRFEGLARVGAFSPSATVPALVVEGTVIFDSLSIMEFANEMASGVLLPAEPFKRTQARSILAWQHAGLSGICSRISFESSFYPLKRSLEEDEIAGCNRLFAFLERIHSAGDGPFLFGSVSLADFALTPAVIRLSRHKAPVEAFPRVDQWMSAVMHHPLVVEWLGEADALPHIWYDDYLVPGQSIEKAFELDAIHGH